MIVISDVHISANRVAGTTPASATALKQFTLTQLENFLETVDENCLIAGDLFDGFSISNTDLLATYRILSKWLEKGYNLVVMRGNHDADNQSIRISSFDLLGELLADRPNSKFMSEPGWGFPGVYCLPHSLNQDIFDEQIKALPECTYAVLHCNVDNNFAKNSDHSLDITREQLENIPAKTVYVGHEHNSRKYGKAFIGGVQWATSVADCMDGKNKYAYRLHPDGSVEPILTWDSAKGYAEVDWRNPVKVGAQFIRMVGHCPPESAAEMANVIARYRKDSDAFVVTNAVRVSENEDAAELTLASLEAVNAFDVMDAVKRLLTAEEITILENLK